MPPPIAPDLAELMGVCAADRRVKLRPARIAEALGVDVAALAPVIAEAEGLGLLIRWGEDILILGALAAERLGLVVDASGNRWIPRDEWMPSKCGPRRTITATDKFTSRHDDSGAWLGFLADPKAVEPLDALIVRESTDSQPSTFMMGCRAWPLPGQSREPLGPGRDVWLPCEACGDRPGRGRYCLACDRPRGSMVGRSLAGIRARNRKGETLRGGKESRSKAG